MMFRQAFLCAGLALDAVYRRGGRLILEGSLEPVEDALEAIEPPLDSAPAGCDQLDQEGEILDASFALCREVALETLETTDRLPGEAAYLGQVARDGEDFLPQTLLESALEAIGHAGLELGGGNGQSFETCPRALEERLEGGIVTLAVTGGGEANTGSFDGVAIHGPQLSLQSGCRHEDVRS